MEEGCARADALHLRHVESTFPTRWCMLLLHKWKIAFQRVQRVGKPLLTLGCEREFATSVFKKHPALG